MPAPVMTMQPTSSSALMARDGLVQLGAELLVHRVELLGAVQGEDRDALRLLDEDVVRHLRSPSPRAACGSRRRRSRARPRIASVCSPSVGARWRKRPGVSDRSTGVGASGTGRGRPGILGVARAARRRGCARPRAPAAASRAAPPGSSPPRARPAPPRSCAAPVHSDMRLEMISPWLPRASSSLKRGSVSQSSSPISFAQRANIGLPIA